MSTVILLRLFGLAGMPSPRATPLARLLGRCPRERLVRAVAWYAWEAGQGLAVTTLLTGVRLIVRGWDDFFLTQSLPSRADLVSVESPIKGRALVTRHERRGRGWHKEPISTTAVVRPEIELATRWLSSSVGCIVHDDCADHPELGAACAGDDT